MARLWDRPADDRTRLAARLLAARNLVSAAILAADSSSRVRVVIATVDGLHAASMIALALASERYRRPALVSAAMTIALGLATAGDAAEGVRPASE